MTAAPPTLRSSRGSVLIVAMLFSAIIGISLASYLRLSTNTLKIATRSFHSNSAIYLAETGIELAMTCITNNQTNGVPLATAWPSSTWTTDTTAHTAIATFTPSSDVNGVVKVLVQNYDLTGNPTIIAKAMITPGDGGPVIAKYLKISLSRRGLFTNGLVAKDGITWVGHPEADSWNSAAASPPVAYSVGVRRDNCIVGCVNGNIALGSGGDVYGYTKTGATGTTSGGSVHGLASTTHDPTRVSTDFSANFPAITLPSPAIINVLAAVPTTLPTGAHSPNSDGRYYYTWGPTLGGITANTTITGNVTITMTGRAGNDAIRLTGTKTLTVAASGSVILYTDGNIDAKGNGIVNTSTAEKFQIYGTGTPTGGQSIVVGGNGNLVAALYAPNASVELKGGGSSGNVMGSVVAKSISMNGGTNFHYDEALGNLNGGGGYRTSQWKELQTAAERSPYTSF